MMDKKELVSGMSKEVYQLSLTNKTSLLILSNLINKFMKKHNKARVHTGAKSTSINLTKITKIINPSSY